MLEKIGNHALTAIYHKTFNRSLSGKNKQFFLIFSFFSNLLTIKVNLLKKKELSDEKNFYLSSKKKLWKSLIYYLSVGKKKYLKLFELLIICKRLNMKKILLKFLNIFLKKKLDFCFFWEIAVILESENAKLNFALDFIFLYGIRFTYFLFLRN